MRITAGTYRGRVLKTTTGPGFRPAMGKVREALFSMLEAKGVEWPGLRVLDLFAGSGSLGFEALSRGAAAVCFVESAPYAAKVIAANAALLGVPEERIFIRREEAAKALAKRPAEAFGLVFIDPPYALNALEHCLTALLKNNWLLPGAIVNAEIQTGGGKAPPPCPPGLEPLTDRTYGQTRVVLWNAIQQ